MLSITLIQNEYLQWQQWITSLPALIQTDIKNTVQPIQPTDNAQYVLTLTTEHAEKLLNTAITQRTLQTSPINQNSNRYVLWLLSDHE